VHWDSGLALPARFRCSDEPIIVLNLSTRTPSSLRDVIPEIDIWRVANLMLKRYGDAALVESARRADELAAAGDTAGVAVWCRIIDAVDQLSNTTPPGPVH
jgi:hypothetical protein